MSIARDAGQSPSSLPVPWKTGLSPARPERSRRRPSARASSWTSGSGEPSNAASSRAKRTRPAGAYSVHAVYGLVPEAYTTSTSDGVSFAAMVLEGANKKILFHRFVDPVHRVHDRGLQSFDATFTTAGPADLWLYTNPGIHNDAACDWAFWGAVRIADEDGR